MKESHLQRKIITALKKAYPSSFFTVIHGGPYQRVGLPDIIGCHGGKFIGMEVKLPGEKHPVTPNQQFVLDQITKARGTAVVVHSVEEALDALDAQP